jgi:hypothetical protein
MHKMGDCCDSCEFYFTSATQEGQKSICRRMPPRVFQRLETDGSGIPGSAGILYESRWPEVKDYDWCGEFKDNGKKAREKAVADIENRILSEAGVDEKTPKNKKPVR